MAWAVPSRREIDAAKNADSLDVLEHCEVPSGWDIDEDSDTSDDAGNLGLYLIRN